MLGGISFGIAIGNTGEGTRTNFMGFPGPPHQVVTFVEDIPPYTASIAEYDLAWRAGAGVEYPLNDKLDLMLEVQYIAGKNDSSSDAFDMWIAGIMAPSKFPKCGVPVL